MTLGPMRVRFAPSPTGALHVGSMRTALFAWLSARSTGGQFILRIEDTDQGRYVAGSEVQILDSLRWLGLDWDEGPEVGGPHEPYVQSLRLPLYTEHGTRLAEGGQAYWCTCSPERLTAVREAQRRASQPTRYDRHCLQRQDEVADERTSGKPAVLRQRIPEGLLTWQDVIRGEIRFEGADLDDSVLIKSDGFPTYHLAVVVDDHIMDITHVIRAEEWIPSTPKHLALYQALGWTPPRFAHVPAVLGGDRNKLSKRRGARNVLEYRDLGYLPDALVNAMVLLGWSSGSEEEIFTTPELCQRFSLDRVHANSAVFDPIRLDALNGVHIRQLAPEPLAAALDPWLYGALEEQRLALVPLVQARMVRLADAVELTRPLLGDIELSADNFRLPTKVSPNVASDLLRETDREVASGALRDIEGLRHRLTALLAQQGVKARDGFRVLYMSILGRPAGVPVFDAMAFIGTEATRKRLWAAQRIVAEHLTQGGGQSSTEPSNG